MRREHFEDDGASFRVRRLLQLERGFFRGTYQLSRRRTPAQRLILAALLFNAPFIAFFVGTVGYAIGVVLGEHFQ